MANERNILVGIFTALLFVFSILGLVAFILVLITRSESRVSYLATLNGDVGLVDGTCILTSVDTVGNTITIENTCTNTGGNNILVTTAGTTTTIIDVLASQTALTESDPLGPQVGYDINIDTVPDNTWRVTTGAGFPGTFAPGVVAGDGGQGNVGGTSWVAPSDGVYSFNAHCTVVPSAYIPNDYQSASIALSLGATTVDPTTGTIPAGGRSSLDLSVGKNGAGGPAAVLSALSVSGTVHVCPTCVVNTGEAVLLHTRIDHTGAAGPVMGTSSSYGLIASTAATAANTPTTITGDFAISPTAGVINANFVVSGTVNIANGAAATARADLVTLYNELAAMPCTAILQGIDLAGLTLTPGVYCYTSSGSFGTGTLTLDGQGNPGAMFVFKFGTTLTTAASAVVTYTGGAQPCGTYWQVGSSATFGATNTFAGTVTALTSITVGAGPGTYAGGLLARNGAVSFTGAAGNVVTAQPSCVGVTPVTANFACHLQVNRQQ